MADLCVDMWPCIVPMATTIVVKRPIATPLQYGRRQGTARCETFTITASIQPLVTTDLKKDEQGDRNEGRVEIFSQKLLVTQRASDGVESDIVVWQGVEYEVYLSQDWRQFANYVRSEARRVAV